MDLEPTPTDGSAIAIGATVGLAGAGASNGRYTLLTELARGGMGRIWIADDARLSRRVAIKQLLDSARAQRSRFERELALTSRLEHPSIVSVQDGGTWSDGQPFYVMKLVRGESLNRVIDGAANVAERVALLPHGLAVVDALAFAHAHGIVHRDLKPENVLVGDFGETVVIDWGLAKDLHATTPELIEGPYRDLVKLGETLGGEVLGTPAYMPPEQALGDAVDERADVYALGAMLYHLLGGVRPYAGATTDDVLASVIAGPPIPLALRCPGVPADLVAIVDKAMARRADDRYANAGELAVDLKRFQSGQLVGAHRYTGPQLLRRWLRKHRAAVIVAALAAVTLATLGVVSFVRIMHEQRDAEAARGLAEQARTLADNRRVAAQGLVTFMLGDLRRSLEPIGKLAYLELPARKALEYLDGRAGSNDAHGELSPDERESRALALADLGDVLRGRGDLAGAETDVRAAIAERARLTAGGDRSPDGRYLDASLHSALADFLALKGAELDAIAEYRAAAAMLAAATAARPDDKRGSRGQQGVLEKLGGVLVIRRDYAAAAREFHTALALAQARVDAAPDDLEAQRDMVAPEHAIGDALAAAGDPAGALVQFRATRARLIALTANAPDDLPLMRMLQLTEHRIGVTLLAQQDVAGGLVALRDSTAVSERLVTRDPENRQWRHDQALDLGRLGDAQEASGDTAGALATYRRSIAGLRTIAPIDDLANRNLAVILVSFSELLDRDHQWQLAEPPAREAVAIAEERVRKDPTSRVNKHALDDAYAQLSSTFMGLHRNVEALDYATRAADLARSLAAADPTEPQVELQQSLVGLGAARCAAPGHGDPHEAFDEALAISARHLAATPGDASWRNLDGDARTEAAKCHR